MSELLGIGRIDFRGGDVEEYKRLSAKALEIVQAKEPGTLQYDVFFNADQTECVFVERFRDSQALIDHAANMAEISPAVIATGTFVHGELLGEPSAELKEKLVGGELPHLFTPYQTLKR